MKTALAKYLAKNLTKNLAKNKLKDSKQLAENLTGTNKPINLVGFLTTTLILTFIVGLILLFSLMVNETERIVTELSQNIIQVEQRLNILEK